MTEPAHKQLRDALAAAAGAFIVLGFLLMRAARLERQALDELCQLERQAADAEQRAEHGDANLDGALAVIHDLSERVKALEESDPVVSSEHPFADPANKPSEET